MRKLLALATLSTAAVVGVAGLAGTASAAGPTGTGIITRPATSYTSPSDASQAVQQLETGTSVKTLCFTEGQHRNGSSIWIRVRTDEHPSFVHRDSIAPSGDIGRC